MNTKLRNHILKSRLLPAVTLEHAEKAVSVAKALQKGGLNLMEITFRTEGAARAIDAIRQSVPSMVIGAGTLLTKEQVDEAREAGAQFGLAPGYQPELVAHAESIGLPFIPGVSTPSEIECAMTQGCWIQKLFPANLLGGPDLIRSLTGPYKHTNLRLIPMGGVGLETLTDYSGLSLIGALGGSWLTPTSAIDRGEFDKITTLVRESIEKIRV
ncbi:MAG: bifunctional 4-hydroxy-2-oxoglutarate aldolase/2-dehydro-3-deoxy-phosphogluconate aldolase [Balneolaceae bacterium]